MTSDLQVSVTINRRPRMTALELSELRKNIRHFFQESLTPGQSVTFDQLADSLGEEYRSSTFRCYLSQLADEGLLRASFIGNRKAYQLNSAPVQAALAEAIVEQLPQSLSLNQSSVAVAELDRCIAECRQQIADILIKIDCLEQSRTILLDRD
jgi:hypothetical protein